jgi:hypothetical protein
MSDRYKGREPGWNQGAGRLGDGRAEKRAILLNPSPMKKHHLSC